jgi:DNA-binding XRE family transcriptional regulator
MADRNNNHPHRRSTSWDTSPDPDEIRALRESLGLNRLNAARLVHTSEMTWCNWERPRTDGQARPMHAGLWELFRLKARTLVNRERVEVLIDKASPPRAYVRIGQLTDGKLCLALYSPDGTFVTIAKMPPDFTFYINEKEWNT